MWLVYDSDEGLVIVTDDYEEALAEYNELKKAWKDYVRFQFLIGSLITSSAVPAEFKAVSVSIPYR